MKQVFNHKEFKKALRTKRVIELDNMGMREAAKQIGTSPATLSRCENSKMPDVITYANICVWLKVPMNTFLKQSKK